MTVYNGFILQATYRIQNGVPVVYLFGRLDSGETFTLRDTRQRPHFYVEKDNAEAVEGASVEPSSKTTFDGDALVEVEVKVPSDAPRVRDKLHGRGLKTYEADVRFAMRYLIDRDIKNGIQIIGHRLPGTSTTWVFENPEVTSAKVDASPRVLSFDIETTPDAKNLLAISYFGLGQDEVVVVDPTGREMPDRAISVPTEKDALHHFATLVRELDVDILTGWNVIDFDLTVLSNIASKVRYDLQLGRDNGKMRIRPAEGYFGSGSAMIPGRVVLDGMDLVRGAFVRVDDYSLDGVSHAILGEGKTLGHNEDGMDKVAQILDTYANDLPKFTEYARTDARLALEIVEKLDLIKLAFARASLTGMTPDRVAASIASFDFLYLAELHKRHVSAPSVASPGAGRIAQGGGAVFEPQAGVHENVWVCDFKSLYPSIIRTFNIDPLGHSMAKREGKPVQTQDGTAFSTAPGILPSILDALFPQRAQAKARGDEVASQAIKILMNSFYGVLGTPACRFYNPNIANAITSQGRHLLHWSRDWFAARGYNVLYGDTDSVFVSSGAHDTQEAESRIAGLVADFNRELTTYLENQYGVQSRLELEYEKLYTRLFLAKTRGGGQGARKRYAGVRAGGKEVEFVGMEVVRRDWTDLAKEVQKALFTRLFNGDAVADYLREKVSVVRAGGCDDQLIYRKGLRKSVDTYTTNIPPHVQAVKKSSLPPPRVVRYVVTEHGPELDAERTHSPDREHYVQKQIRPVAEPVLEALGLNFAQVVGDDKQISLF
ncbi:MAG: DNA polymerase II [Pseudomonadales bacterium]|nr:DNA polymerase II [Pseudomonadales bacterium]